MSISLTILNPAHPVPSMTNFFFDDVEKHLVIIALETFVERLYVRTIIAEVVLLEMQVNANW